MKRNLILTFGLLYFSVAVNAQTLQAPEIPLMGITFSNGVAETFTIGEAGENMLWDYSSFVPLQTGTATCTPATSNPYSDDYPDADWVITSNGGAYFYNIGPDSFEYFGGVEQNISYPMDNSQILFPYPFSYGESFYDESSALLSIQGTETHRTGYCAAALDGYGSVQHPSGLLMDNVYRIRLDRIVRDSTVSGITTSHIDATIFMVDTLASPLIQHADVLITQGVEEIVIDTIFADSLNTVVDTILIDTIQPVVLYEYSIVEVLQSMGVSTEDAEAPDFAMFPNPASDLVTMIWWTQPEAIEFRDATGRLVHTEYATSGLNSTQLDVSGWARGVYLATAIVGEQQTTKQLVVQ